MNKKTLSLAIAYLLVTVSIVTFYPVLFNNIINWNDGGLFDAVSAATKGKAGFFAQRGYLPVVLALTAFQRSFSEYGYFLFHAMSMVVHAANAVLLFFIVRRLVHSDRISLIAGILFAVHPMQVETVAWLSTQSIVFSTFFFLLTCLSYLRLQEHKNVLNWSAVILVTILFYLLGAPSLGLIFVLLGLDLLHDRTITVAHVQQKSVFVLIWAAAFLFSAVRIEEINFLARLAADSVAMFRLGIVEEMLRIIAPFHAPLVRSAAEIEQSSLVYGESVFPFILLTIGVLLFWNKRRTPLLFYGFAFSVIMSLAVFTGRSDGAWALSDHSFYLSSAGFFVMIAWFADTGLSKLEQRRTALWGAYAACICLVVLLIYSGRTRCEYWRESIPFWDEAHAENPGSAFILTQRGLYYHSRFALRKSLTDLSSAVELAPDNEEIYLDRGRVYLDAREIDAAANDFRRAAALQPADPAAKFYLGRAMVNGGKFDSAIVVLSEALKERPSFPEALDSRANAYGNVRNYVLAFADYRRALELNPRYAEAYGDRAFAFMQTGNFQKALTDFGEQIWLTPYRLDAKIHRAFTELLVGDTTSALSDFRSALNADSSNGKLYLLGVSKVFLRSEKETQAGQRLFHRLGIQ